MQIEYSDTGQEDAQFAVIGGLREWGGGHDRKERLG